MQLLISDDLRNLHLTKYPDGHPNGPWEATASFVGEERWWRGFGTSPQRAIDDLHDMGKAPKVTHSIAKPQRTSVNIDGIQLDL